MRINLNDDDPSLPKNQNIYPDTWCEIPPNGKTCRRTGLKHAKLYSLLGKGGLARDYVRVANLRGPGAKQGKTIFHLGDMLRFLDLTAADQGSGQKRHNPVDPPP